MSNFLRKHPLPRPGDVVEITFKKVSPKVQPLFQVGTRFTVERVLSAETRPTLVVSHPTRRKATLAMSCERYAWRIIDKKTKLQESAEKFQSAVDTKLTDDDRIRLSIVSAVFHTLAWEYGDKCISYSIENRVEQTKALTRAAKEARGEWERNMVKSFGTGGFETHRQQVKEIFEHWQTDFAVMYFTVSNEYKRTMPGVPYEELSVNAITGMQVIKVFHKWAKEAGEVLVRRMDIKTTRQMKKAVFNEEKRRYEIYDDGALCAYIGPDGFGFRKELWKTLQEGGQNHESKT